MNQTNPSTNTATTINQMKNRKLLVKEQENTMETEINLLRESTY